MASQAAIPPSTEAEIGGLLGTHKWTPSALTYNFPTAASYYPASYFTLSGVPNTPTVGYTFDIAGTFAQASPEMIAAYAVILPTQFGGVTPLTFTLAASNAPASGVDISIARALLPNDNQTGTITGHAYRPSNQQWGGDTWYSTNSYYGGNPANGDFFVSGVTPGGPGWFVMLHEIGHSVGLKHAHENGTVVPVEKDSYEYTVMTYRDFVGDDASRGYDGERYGRPQTLMMLDLQALQYIYGANFNTNSGDSVYTFSPTTGRMSINGIGQTEPGANRIFCTIWDGGGVDIYNLSNYTTNLTINLAPGAWSTFDAAQLAILETSTGRRAVGNVANALQYGTDTRSLIDNATGGSGNDVLTGNAIANQLNGNNGNDTLDGAAGSDLMIGGQGDDAFFVDAIGDSIFEVAGGGNDRVYASANYSLGIDLEELYLQGSASISGTGSANVNTIQGNAGYNTITGGGSADVLQGFAGNDTFWYTAGTDMATGEVIDGGTDIDTIHVNAGVFVNFAFYNAVITSIERLELSAGPGIADATFKASQVGAGLSPTLHVVGSTTTGASDFSFELGSATRLDLSGLTFSGIVNGPRIDGNATAADTIFGTTKGDRIFSGGGADRLIGGSGPDTLSGGAGADLYYFNASHLNNGVSDVINDISPGESHERNYSAPVTMLSR